VTVIGWILVHLTQGQPAIISCAGTEAETADSDDITVTGNWHLLHLKVLLVTTQTGRGLNTGTLALLYLHCTILHRTLDTGH